ncbi:MAG: tetratricopeptide repeat protein [Opitutales bacterium]
MIALDRTSPVGRALRLSAVALAVFFLSGLASYPLERSAWKRVSANLNELRVEDLENALGQGVVLGVLGGFRTLIADLLFIELSVHWQQKDWAKVEALVPVVTSVDPRSHFFWLNTSRMVAYDIPVWRIRQQNATFRDGGSDRRLTPEEEFIITREQAAKAIEILERGLLYHPNDARLLQDIASTHLNKLGDQATAAEYYLKAWRGENRRFFHARLHAQLLANLGRNAEALAFLREHYEEIPKDHPFSRPAVVLERIRQLESVLNVPESERFSPTEPPPVDRFSEDNL